jgi:serine/threonine protein kinase
MHHQYKHHKDLASKHLRDTHVNVAVQEASNVWNSSFRHEKVKYVGRGAYGFVVAATAPVAKLLLQVIQKKSKKNAYTQFFRYPPAGSMVAIKGQRLDSNSHKRTAYNEMKILETLQGLSFVPKLYGSVVVNHKEPFNEFLILMEFVEGVTLKKAVLQRGKYDIDKIKKHLQKALLQMWHRGVIHADLHSNNVMVTPDSKIYIMDFGLSHETQYIKNVSKKMNLKNNINKQWKIHLEDYANSLVARRHHYSYNPNAKILTWLSQQEKTSSFQNSI